MIIYDSLDLSRAFFLLGIIWVYVRWEGRRMEYGYLNELVSRFVV